MKSPKSIPRRRIQTEIAGSDPQRKNAQKKSQEPTNNNAVEILIAEDSPTQSEYLRSILERRGFLVSVASNGKQALESMRKQKPAIVISDIVMPEMDGYELCHQIKSDDEFKAVPVILLTSLSDPADIIRGLLCAADNFIVKPFDEKYLFSRIEYILVNRKLREQSRTQLGVEIYFAGKRHSITSDRLQILDLLFSTYETAVEKNLALAKVSEELQALNKELEQRVKERTADLSVEIEQRKRVEEELRKLSKAVEQTADSIVITDKEGSIQYVNPAFESLTGYRFSEVKGKTPRVVKSGKHDGSFYKELWQTILSGSTFRNMFINKKKNGELYYEEQTITPLVDDHGRITHFVSAGKDATERQRSEELLRESESHYRMLFDANPLPMWVFDLTTLRFMAVNNAAVAHYEYSREEFLSMTIKGIRPPEEIALLHDYIESLQKGTETRGTWKHKKKDGSIIDVEVTAHAILFSGEKAGLVLANDVTDRKIAELDLRMSEERYRNVFESVRDVIATLSPDGIVTSLNPVFEPMMGWRRDQWIGKSFSDFIQPADLPLARRVFEDALKGIQSPVTEIRSKKKSGEIIVIDFTATQQILNGTLVGVLVVFRDVTERKRLEEQFRQAQKMESIGTLAGGIAHDFNNILGIILGHSALLEKAEGDVSKMSNSIEIIAKATHRGAALVRQLLTFARKTDAVLESVDLNGQIIELIKLLNETFPKIITVETALDKHLPPIMADSTQINQMLLNLCVNARDAMPKGGALTFTTERVSASELGSRVSPGEAGYYVRLGVRDSGIGMDEATRARIFEPFFTTKGVGKGTGLGLAMVYGIVKSLKGFIDVESAPGRGATFHLYIPLQRSYAEGAGENEQRIAKAPTGTETILVVEDEEMLRNLVSVLLESKGYSVLEAEDGLKALEVYRAQRANIALVVSDMGLPKLDGRGLFARLREIDPAVKVIFASGFIDPVQKSELLKDGARGVVPKPYVPEDLLHRIRDAIDQKDFH